MKNASYLTLNAAVMIVTVSVMSLRYPLMNIANQFDIATCQLTILVYLFILTLSIRILLVPMLALHVNLRV